MRNNAELRDDLVGKGGQGLRVEKPVLGNNY